MNKKILQRVLCFCLALCFCFSIAIKPVEAHAVVTESWMIYALITYLAGMGITFTVAGGVNAMIQAMEEKVKDYEQANNIIDFYEYMRNRNVRLVPNNNQDPDGNPFFDLFFTASAVEAIQAFANWLTSEGGWGDGVNNSNNVTGTCTVKLDGVETVITTSSGITNTETDYLYDCSQLGYVIPIKSRTPSEYMFPLGYISYIGSNSYDCSLYGLYISENSTSKYMRFQFSSSDWFNHQCGVWVENAGFTPYWEHVVGVTLGQYTDRYPYQWFLVLDNGQLVWICRCPILPNDFTEINSTVEIMTPEELQVQFPSVDQGVSIADAISVPMGDPTLAEWAQRMEETFDLIGTIPQPVPEVVPDPELVPQPTPAPTPPSYDDIDDLGLPTLGDALLDKFPFCLPSDVGRIMDIFTAERVTPYWEVDLYETLGDKIPFRGDTAFAIDLAEYEELGAISRWTTTIGYCLFLLLITRQMITW